MLQVRRNMTAPRPIIELVAHELCARHFMDVIAIFERVNAVLHTPKFQQQEMQSATPIMDLQVATKLMGSWKDSPYFFKAIQALDITKVRAALDAILLHVKFVSMPNVPYEDRDEDVREGLDLLHTIYLLCSRRDAAQHSDPGFREMYEQIFEAWEKEGVVAPETIKHTRHLLETEWTEPRLRVGRKELLIFEGWYRCSLPGCNVMQCSYKCNK